MSAAREAAARRARLRELLRAKTQADAMPSQSELLQQLGSSASLRTLKRDLQKLRGSVPKGPHTKRPGAVKRSEAGSNRGVTKKMQQIEDRLDAIEQVQSRMIGLLERILPELYESDRKLKDLMVENEYGRIADRKELLADRGEIEHMRDLFAAAVSAAQYEHTKH